MRQAADIVTRLTETLAAAAETILRGVDRLVGAALPRPEAQLVPVRVRRTSDRIARR